MRPIGKRQPSGVKRKDTRHPKPECIKQIVVMLWALQLLSAAVGVDCQHAVVTFAQNRSLKEGMSFLFNRASRFLLTILLFVVPCLINLRF